MIKAPTRYRSRLFAATRTLIAVGVFSIADSVFAYVGNSYMQIPEVPSGWQGAQYTDWVKIDAHYWEGQTQFRGGFRQDHTSFAGPAAPHEGESELVIALDKRNPILAQLMDSCRQKTTFPEVTYTESSVRARGPFEWGPRPAEIPEYYEYKLKDVRFIECPVVADAPDQAIVVHFSDIEWLNYERNSKDKKMDLVMEPKTFSPTIDSSTKVFVLTWFAPAHFVSDDQCPVINEKPAQELYYEFMSKEEAKKERTENDKNGGVSYERGQMALRGPNKLSATLLPGIVPDPVNAAPQTTVARGINLDGDDGSDEPFAGICKHKNYVSADGRTGIDNQLYTVQGCIPGWQGHKGFIHQFANNAMRDGQYSMLIEITGIDNVQNDDSIEITWFYSEDPMAKNAAGTEILPDYTFRITDNPEYSHYFSRTPGRIIDGVLITDRINEFQLVLGIYGSPMELLLTDARLRLELAPDGTIKGVLGGYRDWQEMASQQISSTSEQYFGFQVPAYYNALKRYADGRKDPVTGECNEISTAYDIEGVPAFILPAQLKALKQARTVTEIEKRQ